jgi:hypothetical protein
MERNISSGGPIIGEDELFETGLSVLKRAEPESFRPADGG